MKAVILAAGKDRRLWPLTENRPKPMLPVGNHPILDHIVTELEATPVTEVILVVGSNRERVQTYFEDGRDREPNITYVTQKPQLGTSHALLQAESHVGDSVVILNGDRIVDAAAIDAVWERHRQTGDPTVAITRADHPHKYGVVDFNDDEIAGVEESPHPDRVASEYISTGVYALPPEVFAALRETDHNGEHALTATLSELGATRPVRAVRYRGRWLDVSEPWPSSRSTARSSRILGPTPDTATVAPSAMVADDPARCTQHPPEHDNPEQRHDQRNRLAWVGRHCRQLVHPRGYDLDPGAVVTYCVVDATATVTGGTNSVTVDNTLYHEAPFDGLIGENITVRTNATVRPSDHRQRGY